MTKAQAALAVSAGTTFWQKFARNSATYNGAIFTPMENLLMDLKAHGLQNRTVAVIDNGTWAATAGRQMKELVGGMKNMTVLEESVSLKSSVKEPQREALEALADQLAADILK